MNLFGSFYLIIPAVFLFFHVTKDTQKNIAMKIILILIYQFVLLNLTFLNTSEWIRRKIMRHELINGIVLVLITLATFVYIYSTNFTKVSFYYWIFMIAIEFIIYKF